MREWKNEIRKRVAGFKLEPARGAGIVEELTQRLEDRRAKLLSTRHQRGRGLIGGEDRDA